jgi:hypothetical protein
MANFKFMTVLIRKLLAKRQDKRKDSWDEICMRDPRNPGCKVYDI